MRDERIKELISAYLDGELSVDERAQVERQLADSVECQQFLDHLRQQRMALRSIPRRKLKVDLSQRVLQAIEQARPAAYQTRFSTAVSPRDRAAKRSWWQSWQGIGAAVGTVAALLLVTFYLASLDQKGVNKPNNNNLGGNQNETVPQGPQLPDEVKTPEEMKLPDEVGPEVPLTGETLLALGEFQKLVQFVFVYDITITPQAQKNKVFEGWMAKAGIPVNKGIAINQKLEKEILAARFVGDDKIAAGANGKSSKQEVEMLFVRGTNKQIDAVGREYFINGVRAQPNPEIRIRLDVVVAPQELNIFLQLNKATGLDLAEMKANPTSLKSPSAFPLRFRFPLHSLSTVQLEPNATLAMAIEADTKAASADVQLTTGCDGEFLVATSDSDVLVAQAPAAPPAQPEIDGSVGWDEPTQAIFIIRRLKDAPQTDDANK